MPDAVRYQSIALAITRIDADQIPGDFAELGVWRGLTSSFLQFMNPDRTLHLFDTFQGFGDGRFQDTSVDFVRNRIGDCRNVKFHVGHFPETAIGLDSRFAFVMLDADTYDATLSGLQWFYPRMNSGGYIFLHDYNSTESDCGVRRAWEIFATGIPEKLIEIPDKYGSAVFRKL